MTFSVAALRNNRLLPNYIIVLTLLILILIAGMLVSDRFMTSRNFSFLFQQMIVLGLVALGQTFAILLGGIDLSIGALVGAITVFLASFLQWQPDLIWVAVPAALCIGVAVGALNGALTVVLRVHSLIVTLGMSSIIFGLTLMYRKQPGGSVPVIFEELAYGSFMGIPFTAFTLVAVFAIMGLWLQRSRAGRMIYFVGGNEESARLNGIPVNQVKIMAYALAGFFSALAAIFLTAKIGVGDPRIGSSLTLQSITPVIVGGTILVGGRGGVFGTFLGVLLVSLLNNLLNFAGVSSYWQWVVQGGIIIAAVGMHKARAK